LDLLAEREQQLLAEQTAGVDDEEALRLENSFIDFVEAAWPSIDPAEFQRSFVVEAMAKHLQAVADGHIKRLLLNVPPRFSKTLLASVCFPAWLWAQRERSYLKGSQSKILAASYGHSTIDHEQQPDTKINPLRLVPITVAESPPLDGRPKHEAEI
jgi:hypothetical protein